MMQGMRYVEPVPGDCKVLYRSIERVLESVLAFNAPENLYVGETTAGS
jgi:hypothetical protein